MSDASGDPAAPGVKIEFAPPGATHGAGCGGRGCYYGAVVWARRVSSAGPEIEGIANTYTFCIADTTADEVLAHALGVSRQDLGPGDWRLIAESVDRVPDATIRAAYAALPPLPAGGPHCEAE